MEMQERRQLISDFTHVMLKMGMLAQDVGEAADLGLNIDHLVQQMETKLAEGQLLLEQIRTMNAVEPVAVPVQRSWTKQDNSFGMR